MEDAKDGSATGGKRRMGRSPAYPTLPLDKAIAQVRAFRQREGDYAAPLTSAFAAWGYGAKSSGGRQTLATLKYYGLIEIVGEGETRKIKVSALGRKILLDDREDQTEKQANIRAAALNPSIHKSLYAEYPDGLASDSTVRHFLVFNQGFNEEAAAEVIGNFRETAVFATLYSKSEAAENHDAADARYGIGDYANFDSGGQLQWREPWKIAEIQKHSDGVFYYLMVGRGQYEGQKGWIPEEQLVLADNDGLEKLEAALEKTPGAPSLFAPPVTPMKPPTLEAEALKPGFREDKASLDEGEVILRWPENLSPESVSDLEYWIAGIIRRAKRRAGMTS